MEIIDTLFGEGRELNSLQMSCRGFVMFFITLILIRIAGMRSFGSKSAFDVIIAIMLGALLSRAITGASPAIPVILSGLTMAVIHRLLGILSLKSSFLSHLVKSKELSLYKNGKINEKNLKRCNITSGDLMEGIRIAGSVESLQEVKEVFMERNGEISVVK
jgi:uncharacterized membrane protein YcaP (DUF421 family)